MATSRKRLVSNTDFDGTTNDTHPPKKQKLSSIFSNSVDHWNFEQFLDAVSSAPLVNQFEIPLDINRYIAEYATGVVKDCLNPKCDDKLVFLYQDEDDATVESDDNPYYRIPEYTYFDFVNFIDGWCSDCLHHTIKCECGCWKLKTEDTTDVCNHCEIEIVACDRCYSSTTCHECGDTVCTTSGCSSACKIGEHVLCHYCHNICTSRKIWECGRCDRTITKDHEHCDDEKVVYLVKKENCNDDFGQCHRKGCEEKICGCRGFRCKECDQWHLFCDEHEEIECTVNPKTSG